VNRWNIPEALELEVIERDQACVYCGRLFASAARRGERQSWEHIINDARLVTRENIALCCISCNASKGAKDLAVWLETKYCRNREIHAGTIAPVAQAALRAAMRSRRSAA
jgi:5-methylcytosine-specific restriction endonuclease McrA